MCGIAGIVSKNKSIALNKSILPMSRSISHRGPDGEGFVFFSESNTAVVYSDDTPTVNKNSRQFLFNPNQSIHDVQTDYNVVFAHRRLSIIDLSEAGHQPMCDLTGNYWITLNGEIYNYIELKEELKLKGHRFVSQTDTEVVLAAYKEWGVDCLKRFNGMWAFCLYDKKQNQLFCARDRAGVKPFYYINTNNCFAFASEYKAFIKSSLIPFSINESAQYDFLLKAELETENESLFKDIYELKPSHYIIYQISTHQFNINNYYSLPDSIASNQSEKEMIQQIEEKLLSSVRLRLRSDVEVGSCLSGGLDSSVIVGMIHHLEPEKLLKCFTAVFPNERFNEEQYAKLVCENNNGLFKTVTPHAKDFFNDIETLNYFQDIPIWTTSTYSQYRVMKLASENNVKVVLDGQGADEIFGGYSHHYLALWKEFNSNMNWLGTYKSMNDSKPYIKNAFGLFSKQLIKEKLQLKTNYSPYIVNAPAYYNQPIKHSLNEQLKFDYNGRLKSYLKCEDRCSMAFGIESRVPFSDDIHLVDFLFSIEGKKKIKNGISKYLLREASQSYIPNQIYNRKDKIGFETPVSPWLLLHKTNIIDTIVNELHFVNQNNLVNDFDELLKNSNKASFVLRLYSLAVWKKVFKNLK